MANNSGFCNICGSLSHHLFTCKVLNKYQVQYFKCGSCEFIQTEHPHWLSEAYSSAITSLDIGLIHRNMQIAPILQVLIKSLYDQNAKFIDYGGGYGMLVRMMRDKGFDFYRQDIYCENLFSKSFDVDEDLKDKSGFELLTAFEVFEHLLDPIKELEIMLSYSSDIFFSTSIYPKDADLLNWWYLIPETGQHVSLYSEESLRYLANKYNLNYYCFNNIYHLFTKKVISNAAFKRVFNRWNQKIVNRIKPNLVSLLEKDFNKISDTKM